MYEKLNRVSANDADDLTLQRLPIEAPPPPWIGDEAATDAQDDLLAEFVMGLIDIRDQWQPTPEELELMQVMFVRAASWGWCVAMSNGPMAQRKAIPAAVAAKREIAEATRRKILEAFDRAAKAGRDVSIAEIAKECGVSTATAYRHLKPKD